MPARHSIVAIGEILWDMFPEGPQFGGAPANFGCCVAELCAGSMDVHIVSAVGRDDLGQRALELLRAHGVKTDFVSELRRPTGQVLVQLDQAGQARYEFASDTAWDNIAWREELGQLAAQADAVCFGTLAQRSVTSRETIQRFVGATRSDCLRILDINLRPPFWNQEIVLQSLELANVLKLNDTEVQVVADMLGWNGMDQEILDQLRNRFSLELVALTRGADGAIVADASAERSDLSGEKVAVVNTVGAGDSYTAALAMGLLDDLPLATTNAWANRVAAFVCTQPGAAPKLPASLRIV